MSLLDYYTNIERQLTYKKATAKNDPPMLHTRNGEQPVKVVHVPVSVLSHECRHVLVVELRVPGRDQLIRQTCDSTRSHGRRSTAQDGMLLTDVMYDLAVVRRADKFSDVGINGLEEQNQDILSAARRIHSHSCVPHRARLPF
jgi:hypothetical protein